VSKSNQVDGLVKSRSKPIIIFSYCYLLLLKPFHANANIQEVDSIIQTSMVSKPNKPDSAKMKNESSTTSMPQWHAMAIDECMNQLGVSGKIRQEGLSTTDAIQRLEKYGPNKLSEGIKKSLFERIWAQVANVLVLILVVVAIVSLIKGFTADEDQITYFIEVVLIVFVVV
jgi:magnesium-transporting ATPase (P-type)